MNIILNINDLCDPLSVGVSLNKSNIHFLDKKRNIIMDGEFTKIVFSDEFITMNGVYLFCPILFQNIADKNVLLKNVAYLQPYNSTNTPLLKIYSELEKQILEYYIEYTNSSKTPIYSLHNQLYSGNVKIYKNFSPTDNAVLFPPPGLSPPPGLHPLPKKYVIKLSGIWETDRNIGITYKFLELKSVRHAIFHPNN